MKILQNFSIPQGDDYTIDMDIGPDSPESLVEAQLTFRMYKSDCGVPVGDPVVTKNLDDGLQITDPDYQLILVTFTPEDTIDLDVGTNLIMECTVYDQNGKRVTVAQGVCSIVRTANPADATEWA